MLQVLDCEVETLELTAMKWEKKTREANVGDRALPGAAFSRRDFAKLTFGTLGAILPGAQSMATDAPTALAGASGVEFYVATNGSDQNPGTKSRPFATLEHSRDRVRAVKHSRGLPTGGITVWLREGVYTRSETFELGPEDSGEDGSPVIYRAYQNEKVRLVGGRSISGFGLIRNEAVLRRIEERYRDKILCLNLKNLGITDFGQLLPRGFGLPVRPAALELFFQGQPMTLARWPNDGWAKIGTPPDGANDNGFNYEGDRPLRWREDDDIWVHGYWMWDWSESYLKVESINPQQRQITIYPANGIRGQGFKPGQRYRALNILEELDEPGEWFLDRQTGELYFWPPAPLGRDDIDVSLLDRPLVHMANASHVTLQGLSFECARGSGVEIAGGSKNLIAGCDFRNLGTFAAKLDGGTANGVVGCNMSEMGQGGIILIGGDRQTLVPAGHFAVNNHISRYSRWVRTYSAAINIEGVGHHVAHNLINQAPHMGIFLSGNDHAVELNEIHDIALETSDVGAIYMGRDYTQRGNVIRYNYIHDLPVETSVNAIYLDDCWSGTEVYGNVVYRSHRGVLLGGGRDNRIANNVFIDCHPGIVIDARGLTWARFWFDGRDPTLRERLEAVPYNRPPYSTRYPQLLTLWQDEPALPKGNSVVRNVCYGGEWIELRDGLSARVIEIENNYVGLNPRFVDRARLNFQLREDSPAYKMGFQRIPIEKIGLYSDEYRTLVK